MMKEGLGRLFKTVHRYLKRLNKDFQEGSRKYNKFEDEPRRLYRVFNKNLDMAG